MAGRTCVSHSRKLSRVSFSDVPCDGRGLLMAALEEEFMARVLDVFLEGWL
jgi:hypothetical protein